MTSQTPAPGGDTLQALIRTRIRQDIVSMHGYAIQDSRGLVKLDAMENPHQLSLPLQAELGARLGALAINRYPNARVDDLRHALAAYVDMPAGCDIMLGNGSDELISLLAMAVEHRAHGDVLGRGQRGADCVVATAATASAGRRFRRSSY